MKRAIRLLEENDVVRLNGKRYVVESCQTNHHSDGNQWGEGHWWIRKVVFTQLKGPHHSPEGDRTEREYRFNGYETNSRGHTKYEPETKEPEYELLGKLRVIKTYEFIPDDRSKS